MRRIAAMSGKRELLRHTVATLAYRLARAVEDAPQDFGAFEQAGRAPVNILAHIGDLIDWALRLASGQGGWLQSGPLAWKEEEKRVFAAIAALDNHLASEDPLHTTEEKLFQGPVADALTHVGQLAMLRRLAGNKVRRENFYVATITVGQLGVERSEPK